MEKIDQNETGFGKVSTSKALIAGVALTLVGYFAGNVKWEHDGFNEWARLGVEVGIDIGIGATIDYINKAQEQQRSTDDCIDLEPDSIVTSTDKIYNI